MLGRALLKPYLDGHAPGILHAVARVSSGGRHAGTAGAGCGGDRSAAVWVVRPTSVVAITVRVFSQLAQRGGPADWAALHAYAGAGCIDYGLIEQSAAWRDAGECNGGSGQAPFLCTPTLHWPGTGAPRCPAAGGPGTGRAGEGSGSTRASTWRAGCCGVDLVPRVTGRKVKESKVA